MEKKIYYTLYDAERAAQVYVLEHPDTEIATRHNCYEYATIDDHSDADEDERFVREVGIWSGEMAAIQVRDTNTWQVVALFGWWEDEID